MVRALEFCPGNHGSIPTRVGNFSALLYNFVNFCVLRQRLQNSPKIGFRVIINDDFFEAGECYGPALLTDCLPRQIMHSFKVYIQSLTTASGSRLFGSVVGELDFCPGNHGSVPFRVGNFSAMLYNFVMAFVL